ncbi:MAG: hypothetical protein A2V96_02895 [Candidatus Yonathbacteria bacterium RBG_16_43_6]|uniref:RNA polymerase sigma-70 region 4 domain-containing protein n=2 Tax=Parcubacteria group TaxID=1794811 RepID=A0A1G2SCB6_9BACT|nr:MAG: RNA polymerase sigma factor [Candidatus Azambacteria bacterium GW2011_GWA1_44_9]OHA79895.1 MAG: hypothetical protein A2V96_02895 [Candidatus Yonathbacteria bacterium RBG_16_43_6]OHA82319.1 MAG: hypothetical protein A3B07_02165 [Candidatus Yonathbacteria bacterium RIFCSPLOWO2_01_FULL_43_27]
MNKNKHSVFHCGVKERNMFILDMMKKHGISSVVELSQQSDICQTLLLKLINKELSPQDRMHRWRPCVLAIAKFFSVTPYELFEEDQICITSDLGRKRAKECFNASWEDISFALRELSFKEREVLSLRFGFGEGPKKTLEEIKKVLKISAFCIGEIEKKAIGKVKYHIVKKKKKSR